MGNDRDYPIPSYAVYVWIAGDKLHVCFPPTLGTKSHSVTFPANAKGADLFFKVMRERKPGQLAIGSKAEPTAYQLERALVKDKKYNEWLDAMHISDERQAELEKLLEEIGL